MDVITDFAGWTPEQIISYCQQVLGVKSKTPEEWAAYDKEQKRKEREAQARLKDLYETGRYLVYKKTCPVCGTVFYTTNQRRVYDDYYKCSRYVHRKNAKEMRKLERFTTCQECKKYFTPKRGGAKYCCAACKQKAYRKRKDPSGQSDHTDQS